MSYVPSSTVRSYNSGGDGDGGDSSGDGGDYCGGVVRSYNAGGWW